MPRVQPTQILFEQYLGFLLPRPTRCEALARLGSVVGCFILQGKESGMADLEV